MEIAGYGLAIDATTAIIAGAAIAALILVVVAFFVIRSIVRRRRERRLHDQFGNEYERTVEQTGDSEAARRKLDDRAKRVESFELHSLSESEREQFAERWLRVQADFVDHPGEAVLRADALFVELMARRGYADAAEGPERRAEDLSVGHTEEAEEYREVRRIAASTQASTEDLRNAMRRLRRVFDSMMEPEDGRLRANGTGEPVEAREPIEAR